ncbi:MAG: xanthine dehydrogenase family protein molybdopterin-binding subunit [Litoreibacter sp.]|nr:xanthine dehydrogenase family protein molybdopterin-binding subunit [Litoreibacter sp.]
MNIDDYPKVSDWIELRQGRICVHSGKVDIGQRISTALIRIASRELTSPADQIDVSEVRTDQAPDEGITSGSNSVEHSGRAVGLAATTLRAELARLAAAQLGVDAEEISFEDGAITHRATNQKIAIIDLMDEVSPDLMIDTKATFAHATDVPVGAPFMRGMAEMVKGEFTFVHDIDLPEMLHARVVRPPHALSHLENLDQAYVDKLSESGMQVLRDGSFLAIAGPSEWHVIQAAERLQARCQWSKADLPTDDVFARLTPENATRFNVVDGTPQKGPLPPTLEQVDYSARYQRPYQLHGALAPSAACAEWRDNTLHVMSHSQGIYPLRESMADSLGLAIEDVVITHVPGSGCYGHNGADDAAFEAALIAHEIPDTPILLKWSRADEHAWEPFAPAMAVDLAAKLDEAGKITSYTADAFSDTHRGRPRPGPDKAGPARLLSNRFRADPMDPYVGTPNMNKQGGMHRNLDPIYDFPERRLTKNLVTGLPHRTSALRCLGAAANIFALESFMDELRLKADRDPFDYRLSQLEDPRSRDVLTELQARVAALPVPAPGEGRGIAYAQYKNAMTRVGICVDLEVTDEAEVRLKRAVIVADAGRIVDRDGLMAQLEGGFIQGASWALYEQVTWDWEGIQSRDWDSYPVMRFGNVPPIDVHLIEPEGVPSAGAGEASPSPTIAAIANAIFEASAIRVRQMPFTPEAIMQAAMDE